MAKQQRLTLQHILDEIFIDILRENDEEDHLEEVNSDSAEYSPELKEAVQNEMTDTCEELVRQLKINVSAFIEPVARDFVVLAAV